jgi:uncharacterized membrane protein YecN with MAPEG domain
MQSLAALPVISVFYLGLNALLLIALAIHVVYVRVKLKVIFGDGGEPAMQRAIRVQGNALEYVPMVVVMMLALEMSGLNPQHLHGIGLGLTLGRLLHAVGLGRGQGTSAGRGLGTLITWAVFIYAAVMCLKVSLFHI